MPPSNDGGEFIIFVAGMYSRNITGRCIVRYKMLSLVVLDCEIASIVVRLWMEYMPLLSVPQVWFHTEQEISHKSECAWLLTGTAQRHIRSKACFAIAWFRQVLKWSVGFHGMQVLPVSIATLIRWNVFESRQQSGSPIRPNGFRIFVYKHDKCFVLCSLQNMNSQPTRELETSLVGKSETCDHGN